jgi:hypothetical protein
MFLPRFAKFAFVLGAVLFGPLPKAFSATWEVAVVFLGADEAEDFQKDIDKNIRELFKTEPNDKYHLAVLRDFPNKTAQYFNTSRTRQKSAVTDGLFFKMPSRSASKLGTVSIQTRPAQAKSVLDDENQLKIFFQTAYSVPSAKRLLVVYGHGEGYKGLRQKKIINLSQSLTRLLPARGGMPLDILWFDSCFMGSIEALYQLRALSPFFVSSEDAEFSAGTPFEIFEELGEGPDDTKAVATNLATRFVESYSFIEQGSQTRSVIKSAATINVIESAKLKNLMPLLKDFAARLGSDEVIRRVRAISNKISMGQTDLVDLGQLTKRLANLPVIGEVSKRISSFLEVSKSRIKTNSRIKLKPDQQGALVVFGFENWSRGWQKDLQIVSQLPGNLKPAQFVDGPKTKKWPARKINKQIYVSPFMPGLQTFNFFFADPKTLQAVSPLSSFQRTQDYDSFTASSVANPIVFSAYTQAIGSEAEKYTGLNISDPGAGVPTIDYIETDFFKETQWGNAVQ